MPLWKIIISSFVSALGRKVWREENIWKPHKGKRTCFVFDTKEELQNSLFGELEREENIVFVSNSKKRVDVISSMAKNRGVQTLSYTSDSNSCIVTEDWNKCQLLAFSPTISAGVSYEQKHFESCFSHFTSLSAGAHRFRSNAGKGSRPQKEPNLCFRQTGKVKRNNIEGKTCPKYRKERRGKLSGLWFTF
ncbi:hypothetical protein GMAR_ORF4 [Golden Marseillevirus]|uniref:hypothetical protein n=1 Tax=Golden Marseillevirus TaxID=1720526 RepID=UPI000877ABAA|nr:hypothetical protein GMAR_ORF4 [Golden Marseillevirus]ALX27379.1 hypothetical protein GMAR_ORF4 [Golden Marseillevirus]